MTKSSRRKGMSPKLGKFEHLEDRRLMALTTELAYDLNATPAPTNPEDLTLLGDTAYFMSGNSLWSTKGEVATTTQVKDFSGVDSFPDQFQMHLAGSHLVLFGESGFWSSDGTSEGTVQIREAFQPITSAGIHETVEVEDTLFFVARTTGGDELWTTDGTSEGTARVPLTGSSPRPIAEIDGLLLFMQVTADMGREAWVTDGTEAGTIVLTDTSPDMLSGNNLRFATLGSKLLFSSEEGIWETDGTPQGTRLLQDLAPDQAGPVPRFVGSAGSFAYFTITEQGVGHTLWRTDGVENGATPVKFLGPNGNLSAWTTLNDRIFFTIPSATTNVWVSDGTPDGTEVVAEFTNRDGFQIWNTTLTTVNDEVFIGGTDLNRGIELWKSDGTSSGTTRLKSWERDTPPESLTEAVALNDRLLYANSGYLQLSDGTPEGTGELVHVNPLTFGSEPRGFFGTDEFLLTVAGRQLWSFRNSASAPEKVWQGIPGQGIIHASMSQQYGLVTGAHAYFLVESSDLNTPRTLTGQLWATGGTAESTHLLFDFGRYYQYFGQRFAANGRVYFVDPNSDLWVTQGTPETTLRLLDGIGEEIFKSAIALGDRVYFGGPSANLWVTEGTPETTRLVFDFTSNLNAPSYFTELKGTIYFSGATTTPGQHSSVARLWRTDGTPEGTRTVLPPLSTFATNPRILAAAGDYIYFESTFDGRPALFVSDGTAEGTRLLYDRLGQTIVNDPFIVAMGSRLYFRGEFGTNVLVATDGTSTATAVISEHAVGGLIAVNGLLFYRQHIGPNQSQSRWWRTDGTPEGTFPLTEPREWSDVFNTSGGNIFFGLTRRSDGEGQLWKSDGTVEGTVVVVAINVAYESPTRNFWPQVGVLSGDIYYRGGRLETPVYEPWRIRAPDGDVNFDGEVDLEDLNHVRNQFGYVGHDRPGDANGDGVVGLEDLNEVRNNFGGAPVPSASMRVAGASVQATADVAPSPQRRKTEAAKLDELLYTLAEDQLRDARPFGPLKRTVRGAKSLLDGPKDAWDRI
jgi:ELWxxDGT repeat protein